MVPAREFGSTWELVLGIWELELLRFPQQSLEGSLPAPREYRLLQLRTHDGRPRNFWIHSSVLIEVMGQK